VRGAVSPAVFMPAIDTAGLSSAFALMTLRGVLRQQGAWRAEGHAIKVAANLSARHVVTGEAPLLLRDALAREGGDAADLEIEVTEDILIRDPDMAGQTLARLREAGVRVALDDFGTGYSSLGYLQQLTFDTVKLDRAFVAGLGSASAAERIVDAVVSIAHGLGARVVAEGVETVAQLARLRAIGCDEAQGFLLGRPIPAADLVALLRSDANRPPAARLAEATRAA
jgi:EAL domain-containing protein (putative c-di-GMP-specific phosphodiesterase class I)